MTEVTKNNEVKINAYAADLNKRYDDELKNGACAASLKFITDVTLTVSQKSVAALLKKSNVSEVFSHDKRVENKYMCMKAINSVDSLLKFATRDDVKHLKSNLEEVLRTLVNFKNANVNFTVRDIEDSLNASAKIDDTKKALIYQRRTQFANYARHANMSMRALHALNLIEQKNKTEYAVNNNAIFALIEAKLSA
jgi:hypothetical protein